MADIKVPLSSLGFTRIGVSGPRPSIAVGVTPATTGPSQFDAVLKQAMGKNVLQTVENGQPNGEIEQDPEDDGDDDDSSV